MLTVKPRDSRMAPRLAAVIPLPSEETTPPVIKTKLVMLKPVVFWAAERIRGRSKNTGFTPASLANPVHSYSDPWTVLRPFRRRENKLTDGPLLLNRNAKPRAIESAVHRPSESGEIGGQAALIRQQQSADHCHKSMESRRGTTALSPSRAAHP